MKLTNTSNIPALVLSAATALILGACNDKETTDASSSASGSNALGIGTAGGVELKTELPKEVIEGSPKPKGIKNLAPETKKFPKFLVPEGTVNLAQGKKVSASDDYPILGEPELITDGEKETGEGYFLELIEGTQWVQIDLEKSCPIYAIVMWHFHGQKRAYHDIIVQVSDDPEFKESVTLFNNDYDNSSKLGKGNNQPYIESRFGQLVDAKGTQARYVRLYSNGNSANEMNHYIEVEVFGKPE
ncbi:MAG TPA: hypothetical protein DEP88_03050 [Verrucomicrobiales bacterium]|jgi:hypothetical protein|nr:hypothetical protein [Verrucomicrobiales bacterium]HCI92566.1 hypothetical protein [Verrucomicrobiales bacterium]HCL96654.1 hypothetical protein [Verrucomicrobiales bacterium]